jgi:hypothetical protein
LSEKNDPSAQCVTQHYSSLFKKICDEATPLGRFQGAVYSHLTKGFLGINLENLTDVSELRSLYGLIGGYGMALIESDLVRLIVGRAERIRAFIASNSSPLHNFKQKHADAEGWEAVLGAAARDIKGLDEFLADLMVIGNAVALRRGIAEAVRQSQAETVPFAGSAVAMARVAIKREAYEESTQGLSFLAQESCGLMGSLVGHDVDHSVKVAVLSLGGSTQEVQTVWSYLPFAFAAGLVSETWKAAVYDSKIDAMTNNLHMGCVGLSQLFKCFTFKSEPAADFVKAASFVLLRMKSSEAFALYPVRAMTIFLEKFIADTYILGRSVLQENLPYSIVHSSLVDLSALGLK